MAEEKSSETVLPPAPGVGCDTGLDEAVLTRVTGVRKGKPALTCVQALELANEFGLPPARIGEACNRLGIKIMKCQLECFS